MGEYCIIPAENICNRHPLLPTYNQYYNRTIHHYWGRHPLQEIQQIPNSCAKIPG